MSAPTGKQIQEQTYGADGFNVYSDTSLHTGTWFAVKAINADAVIATLTVTSSDALTAFTLQQGDLFFGPITGITLTSGKVVAYKIA